MIKLLWIPVSCIALVVPIVVLAGGGQVGFDGVVNTLESRYYVHATRIPFLGLISLISSKATHEGVGNLHVAEFDNFTASVDGEELNTLVEQKLGPGWERIIRETTHHAASSAKDPDPSAKDRNEQTLIFMRPEGNRMGLFVLDLDGHEMDVVQVSVDPDHLNQSIDRYGHHHDDHDRDSDHDADHDVSD
jgi:hypothetical protein